MIVTGTINEAYNFNISLARSEYLDLISIASAKGITLESGLFLCLSTPAFISAINATVTAVIT